MALLSRLFSSRKNSKQHLHLNVDNNERSSWKPFAFSKDQVRVLLFRECDWRGRKLLFDSNAVHKVLLENSCKLRFSGRQKVDKTKKDAYVEITNGCGYQYTKPSADATLFGEMMFGAVAMAFRGTALKVHSIPNPNRLMCTKVFPSPEIAQHVRTSDRSLEDSFGSSINSMNEYFSQSGSDPKLESGPLDVPSGTTGACNSLTGDSGFCGDFSMQTVSSLTSSYWAPVASPDNNRSGYEKQSGSSLSSLQRRWLRNVDTSLELGGRVCSEEMMNAQQHRRTRLGLSVLIALTPEQHREMELFVFEHMSVIESMIERLRNAIEKAYLRKDMFVHLVYEGFVETRQSLTDMFSMPRLDCPMWLNLGLNTTDSKRRANLSASFLQDLCQLISSLDTKATNFFVSTLLTGILTHHLGWVNTVCSEQNLVDVGNRQSLSNLSRSNPYNPLWAQLGDLYGAVGSPSKVAKTIVTSNGRKTDCVNKLLTAMTYFIRCGEVKESVNMTRGEVSVRESQNSWVNIEYHQNGGDSEVTRTASPEIVHDGRRRDFILGLSNAQPRSDELLKDTNYKMLSKSSSNVDASNAMCQRIINSQSTIQMPPQKLTQTSPNKMHFEENVDVTERNKWKEKIETRCKGESCSQSPSGVCSSLLKPIQSPDAMCSSPATGIGCFSEDGRKSLNARLEMLSQQRDTAKRFPSHNLKGGNFCSPAGVEWEIEDLASPTSSGRVSVERDFTPDRSTIGESVAQETCPRRSESFREELIANGENHDGRTSKELESSRTRSDCVRRTDSRSMAEMPGTSSKDNVLENSSDNFHPASGNMKRSHSCRTKLSNLNDVSSAGLYPNIEELAKMENIRLDTDSPYLEVFNYDVRDGNSSSQTPTEDVTEKVSKLCRVPTSAILFHLEPEEFQAKPMECFNTKVMESERQTDSNNRYARSVRNVSAFRQELDNRGTDDGVLFVLGENEELKGIKHHHGGAKNSVSCDSTDMTSDVPTKVSFVNNAVNGNVSEPKVVTVRSDYIDLEVESGCFKTENIGESYLTPSPTHLAPGCPVNDSTSVSRSCSINLPVAKRNRIRKISRVCRRHTEIYCDQCKTILKERRKFDDFSLDGDLKTVLTSCEKCHYSNLKHSIGCGNFRRTKSEKYNLNLINDNNATVSRSHGDIMLDIKRCDEPTAYPRQATDEEVKLSPREENAMFEQYNPSDDEILVPKSRLCETKPPDLKEFVYEDLQVIELPLARCHSSGSCVLGLAASLLGGVSNRYIPDLVLQGCCLLPIGWETALRRDLSITAKLPLLGQEITEAVCLVANTNTWEVQLVSSHSYVVDKPGTLGVRVGMSQLVANMLESLNHLFQLKTPAEDCLSHVESKLRELVLRSQALAELLLTTEFCNMELLTSTLDLEANDVPLLLAIATTHSPQIATRYGLSFM